MIFLVYLSSPVIVLYTCSTSSSFLVLVVRFVNTTNNESRVRFFGSAVRPRRDQGLVPFPFFRFEHLRMGILVGSQLITAFIPYRVCPYYAAGSPQRSGHACIHLSCTSRHFGYVLATCFRTSLSLTFSQRTDFFYQYQNFSTNTGFTASYPRPIRILTQKLLSTHKSNPDTHPREITQRLGCNLSFAKRVVQTIPVGFRTWGYF
jgi:hypothetical protein